MMVKLEQFTDVFQNLGLYLGLAMLVFGVLGILFSLRKGVFKNVFNLVAVIVAAILSFVVAGITINIVTDVPAIADVLNDSLSSLQKFNIPADAVLAIGKALALMVVLPIVFLLVYWIVKIIFFILYRISLKRVDKRLKTRRWRFKPIGLVTGFLTGVIVFLMLFSPVIVLLNLLANAVDTIPPEAVMYVDIQKAEKEDGEIENTEGEKKDLLAAVDELFPTLVEINQMTDGYRDSFFCWLTSNIGFTSLYGMAPIESPYEGNAIKDVESLLHSVTTLASYVYCDKHMDDFIDTFVDGDISEEMDAALNEAMFDIVDSDLLTDVIGGALGKGLGSISDAMKLTDEQKASLEASVKMQDADKLTEAQKRAEGEQVAEVIRILLSAMSDLMSMTSSGEGEGEGATDTMNAALDHFGTLGKLMDTMDATYSFGGCVEELLRSLSQMEVVTKYLSQESIESIINSNDTYENIMNTLAATVKMAQSGLGGLS